MSTIDDPRRVPTESGLATARANPTTTAAAMAAAREIATQYFHKTAEEKIVIMSSIIDRHISAKLDSLRLERDASMEILDTVARGFELALARVLAWDRFGAENELKLAIAHIDNPHGYTGKSMAQLRADLAAKGEALKRYRETAANINSMWMAGQLDSTASGYHGKCAGEIANLKAIGVLLDEALASRADKGGAA